MPLDNFDRAILNLVQVNNLISHSKIGEEIGLSTSSVRRRLQAMRDTGVIQQDVSIISPSTASVTLIVSLAFMSESPTAYRDFEKRIQKLPEVMQCYHVAGIYDFMLIVKGPSLEWYENWSEKNIMSDQNIRRYDTTVVWSCKKFKTQVAV